MSKIKDAALEVLSKGKTLEQATEGFSADELHELAYVLEKAKFISPEQQRANKQKATQEANRSALAEANILPKNANRSQSDGSNFKHSDFNFKHVKAHPWGHEYSVHHGDDHLGYLDVDSRTGEMGGSVDVDEPRGDAAFKAFENAHLSGKLPKSSPVLKRPDDANSIATSSDGDFHENQAIAHEKAGNHEVARAHYALSSNAAGSPDQGLLSDSEIRHHQKTIRAFHNPPKTGHLKVIKEDMQKSINKKTGTSRYGKPNPDVKVKEVLKTDKNGQWSLDKAIKPGPTLDYSKFNQKPDYKEIEANAPTIDYGNKPTAKPKWSGAADRAQAVRAKIDAQAKETAAETIARRQGVKKGDGVNVEPELTPAQKERMVAKNEMMGYGSQPQSANPADLMQSEDEPHKDDPHHEEKEKKKAKKIKEEAEKLIDMHE